VGHVQEDDMDDEYGDSKVNLQNQVGFGVNSGGSS